MNLKNLVAAFMFILFSNSISASDLEHPVSGADVEDLIGKMESTGVSPYIVDGESADNVDQAKVTGEDFIFNNNLKEVSVNADPRREYKDFGYTIPGSLEKQENYMEIDKAAMAKGFRKVADGALNITFIKNDFSYGSTNDVINRTITSGSKSVKGGYLLVRHDSYITRSFLLNTFWSLGAGIGFNSGKGYFVDGSRSEAVFKLWEFPVDLGVGLEIPLYHWFKIVGAGGASGMLLMQNRSDFEDKEKGKRKYQLSPGYFASAQFKINLTGFGGDAAYEAFTTSQITNLSMNLELRQQNYSSFNDAISVSGTSFGIGFTFEYL